MVVETVTLRFENLQRAEEKIRQLPPALRHWVENWIDGIARIVAFGPEGEYREEFKHEYDVVKKLLMEKIDNIIRYAERWKERLKEAFAI